MVTQLTTFLAERLGEVTEGVGRTFMGQMSEFCDCAACYSEGRWTCVHRLGVIRHAPTIHWDDINDVLVGDEDIVQTRGASMRSAHCDQVEHGTHTQVR